MLFTGLALLLSAAAGPQGQAPAEAARLRLEAGNERFCQGTSARPRQDEGLRRDLARTVHPWAIVITSADSRVAPEHVFDAGLGDLVVIRVGGAVCDPATLASLELAVAATDIPLCVVLGFDRCSALERAEREPWTTPAGERFALAVAPALRDAARSSAGGNLVARAAAVQAHRTITHALGASEFLRERRAAGRLELVPATFDSATGRVRWSEYHPGATPSDRAATRRVPRVRGLPPHVAEQLLRAGHRRFIAGNGTFGGAPRTGGEARAQSPIAVVVTDIDSRIAPEFVFDAGPGDLYVVRVAGPMTDAQVVASVEHAVDDTGASLVIVLGTDRSEAIAEAIRAGGDTRAASPGLRVLFDWLQPSIRAARAEGLAGAALSRRTAELNCGRVADHLRSGSPVLRQAERGGFVTFLSAVYEPGPGDLRWLETQSGVNAHAAPAGESAGHGGGHGHGGEAAHDADDAHGHGHDGEAADDGYGRDGAVGSQPVAHASEAGNPDPQPDPYAHSATPDPSLEHAGPGSGALLRILLGAIAIAAGGVSVLLVWRSRVRSSALDQTEPDPDAPAA